MYGTPPGGTIRRRTDISSGSRTQQYCGIAKPSAMGLLLLSGTSSSSTGSPGDAATRTRRQVSTPPHPHQTMPLLSTRTSIDSPGLITSVGYILITGRSAAVGPNGSTKGPIPSYLWPASSYPGGPVRLRLTNDQPLGRLSGRINVPSSPDVAVL